MSSTNDDGITRWMDTDLSSSIFTFFMSVTNAGNPYIDGISSMEVSFSTFLYLSAMTKRKAASFGVDGCRWYGPRGTLYLPTIRHRLPVAQRYPPPVCTARNCR